MKIISEFRDYYDVVQALGQDQTLVYLRKREKAPKDWKWPFPVFKGLDGYWRSTPEGLSIGEYIVGFCGKIYPALKLSKWLMGEGKSVEKICHDLAAVDHFVETHFREKDVEHYYEKHNHIDSRVSRWMYIRRHHSIEEFFRECEEKRDVFRELFIEHHCPVFVSRMGTCGWWHDGKRGWVHEPRDVETVFNGSLREVEFYRVVEPFMAFQEISMFMSNLAVPFKQIPEISDKVLAEAKGFNKWSFRKEPRKKK